MKPLQSLLPLAAFAFAQEGPAAQMPLEPTGALLPAQPLTLDGIPLLGFGTWNLDKSNASEAVSWAIQSGYRHIDCAAAYGNEYEVGRGIADGLMKTGLSREDLWITSKLWNDHHGANKVESGFLSTVQALGVGYLDLYHMHWPVGSSFFGSQSIEYRETWAAMTTLLGPRRARHIGVCNFSPHQLRDLLNHTSYPPSVHQMELHPYLQQDAWLAFHREHGIHVTAYSPLGGTNPTYEAGDLVQLLNNTVVRKIAKRRACTPAQVALAWGMSRGTSVIPKSQHKDRIVENLYALECDLSRTDLRRLGRLGEERHRYNNPSGSWKVDLYEGLEDSTGEHKKHS